MEKVKYIAICRHKCLFFVATLLEIEWLPEGWTLDTKKCDSVHLLIYVGNSLGNFSDLYVFKPHTDFELLHVTHSSYYRLLS